MFGLEPISFAPKATTLPIELHPVKKRVHPTKSGGGRGE